MDLTVCPECDELAEVQWRAVMESTDGPVEHAKVMCVRRHWFLLPVSHLVRHQPRHLHPRLAPRASRAPPAGSSVEQDRSADRATWWREEWRCSCR